MSFFSSFRGKGLGGKRTDPEPPRFGNKVWTPATGTTQKVPPPSSQSTSAVGNPSSNTTGGNIFSKLGDDSGSFKANPFQKATTANSSGEGASGMFGKSMSTTNPFMSSQPGQSANPFQNFSRATGAGGNPFATFGGSSSRAVSVPAPDFFAKAAAPKSTPVENVFGGFSKKLPKIEV